MEAELTGPNLAPGERKKVGLLKKSVLLNDVEFAELEELVELKELTYWDIADVSGPVSCAICPVHDTDLEKFLPAYITVSPAFSRLIIVVLEYFGHSSVYVMFGRSMFGIRPEGSMTIEPGGIAPMLFMSTALILAPGWSIPYFRSDEFSAASRLELMKHWTQYPPVFMKYIWGDGLDG